MGAGGAEGQGREFGILICILLLWLLREIYAYFLTPRTF